VTGVGGESVTGGGRGSVTGGGTENVRTASEIAQEREGGRGREREGETETETEREIGGELFFLSSFFVSVRDWLRAGL
jgi:hypothetical protein